MKLNYRPEIDGLRAVAVISVILYHAQVTILGYQPFQGGFIGVDIFFVISGYLITSIILKELLATGSFSFTYFYQRRVRRILPALLFVMLVSLPFAWMYMLPISIIDFSKSILYSLGFSSNFYFHYSGQLYGAESGLLKPFLHTWSLSVEEQFYIFFPIILLITCKFFKKYLIYILILGLIFSLGLADWASKNYSSFNFYVLPTRGWELLAGSILAYFEITKGHRSKNQVLNLILPITGLILIGHSILFFNDKMFHPSFYTISPILGVCLIIWFSNKDEIITKLLSTKLFVGIGLISYSLYLWHYPIFAFDRITEFSEGDLLKKIIIGIIVLGLSIISYYLVERPSRNKKYNFNKLVKILLIISIVISSFSSIVIFKKGFIERYPPKFQNILEGRSKDILKNLTGKNVYNKNIRLTSDAAKKNIFLVGDSHAETLVYSFFKNNQNNYNLNYSVFRGCQLILNVNRLNKKTLKKRNDCQISTQEKRINFINKTENSIVIFFNRLPLILEEDRFYNSEYGFYEGEMEDFLQNEKNSLSTKKDRQKNIKNNFTKTINKLLEKNHDIILVYPMPEVGIDVPNVLINNFKFDKYNEILSKKKIFSTSYEIYRERTKSSFKLLDSIQGDKIYRIYPHKLFCDSVIKDRCVTNDSKNIFYRDDDHPSLKAAEMINELIKIEIKKIEEIEKIN